MTFHLAATIADVLTPALEAEGHAAAGEEPLPAVA